MLCGVALVRCVLRFRPGAGGWGSSGETPGTLSPDRGVGPRGVCALGVGLAPLGSGGPPRSWMSPSWTGLPPRAVWPPVGGLCPGSGWVRLRAVLRRCAGDGECRYRFLGAVPCSADEPQATWVDYRSLGAVPFLGTGGDVGLRVRPTGVRRTGSWVVGCGCAREGSATGPWGRCHSFSAGPEGALQALGWRYRFLGAVPLL